MDVNEERESNLMEIDGTIDDEEFQDFVVENVDGQASSGSKDRTQGGARYSGIHKIP